ncbi:MAG: flagellar motor protein MotB, partial [Veillonella sp.]|nr:flagellar motor protein MotB [Veillonella sp.]
MNKKLLALLAVAAMGISVVGATPQTSFTKGETQIDLGASKIKGEAGVRVDD